MIGLLHWDRDIRNFGQISDSVTLFLNTSFDYPKGKIRMAPEWPISTVQCLEKMDESMVIDEESPQPLNEEKKILIQVILNVVFLSLLPKNHLVMI